MSYQQALDYIYSFANFETRPASQQAREDYTLDRIRALMAGLRNPQDRYPAIHVAGTKGKGSTCAMLAAILGAAGCRAGLYTSPHLHSYRERIRIDGRLIDEGQVVGWIEQHRPLLDTFQELTTFEVTTAMAFDTFAQAAVDLAVIEVGLGGRLDTTNIITPVVAVITSISLDHTAILGDTISQIARDKAGIIKPGVPVVSAPQPPDAAGVIEGVADELGAPLRVVGRDWGCRLAGMSPEGQSIEVAGPAGERWQLWMPLLGAHEAVNATVAIAAACELGNRTVEISPAAIAQGLCAVEWPGRTEILSRQPWIMVDGAHNGASVRCLLETVERLLGPRRIILIFGSSLDKEIGDMLELLVPAAHRLLLTRAHHPRAADPARLAEIAGRLGCEAEVADAPAEALIAAVEAAGPEDLILVTGSLFVVAEARLAWLQHTGRPLPPCDPPADL